MDEGQLLLRFNTPAEDGPPQTQSSPYPGFERRYRTVTMLQGQPNQASFEFALSPHAMSYYRETSMSTPENSLG